MNVIESLRIKQHQREFRINAALRALSIVGKLPPSEFKAKHTRRIMINLNKLRAGKTL